MYVVVVALLSAFGFVAQTPWPILVAACLTLPASVVALPGYYVAYGLLAWATGANSTEATGSSSSSPDGTITSTVTGSLPTWFSLTTSVLGVAILTGGAIANLYLLRRLRRGRKKAAAPPAPAEREGTRS